MWQANSHSLQNGTIEYTISERKNLLSNRQWIDLIQHSEAFIIFFNDLLRLNEFEGFYWEVKPVNEPRLHENFTFVLVRGDILHSLKSDSSAFKKHFTPGDSVVSFPNLGGDAQLVVPAPLSAESDYGHLAKFVRTAPADQILKFWKTVGEQYSLSLGQQPKWLSTAGLGVFWLHIRIDSRPKYYRHNAYK